MPTFAVEKQIKGHKDFRSMEKLQVKDKTFAVSIPEAQILEAVKRVAGEINRDFDGKEPLFLPVLNGAFMFAADLLKEITIPCEVSFIKLASYQGTQTSGTIREVIGLAKDITGHHVIIVEDIIDSGLTMAHMIETLAAHNPASIAVCSCLVKPDALKVQIPIDYRCIDIPNDFIVGYGLDYDGFGRNTRDIYTLV